LRGGSCYSSNDSILRCAYRFSGNPVSRGYGVGFRCARTGS
jgi:formylglycine-generating enzyme required for sulfatase activity